MIGSLGFLGAGAMAEALLDGILQVGLLRPERILVTNRADDQRLNDLARRFGVRITRRRSDLAEVEAVLLCAKPKDAAEAVAGTGDGLRPGQLLISVAAGVPTSLIESWLPFSLPVVRAMPNTSAAVRQSATAFALGTHAGEEAAKIAHALFGAVGEVIQVEEAQLDAVTAVSGSGPAYVYLLMESLHEAALSLGLEPDQAKVLVDQTFRGAVAMTQASSLTPAELRRRVTSPGGTTEAAIGILERGGFQGLFMQAVKRAEQRAGELASALLEASRRGRGAS